MHLSTSEKGTVIQLIRHVLYFVLMVIAALSLRVLVSHYRADTFWEFSIVENIQLSFLLLATGVFGIEAFILKNEKELFFFMASLCLLASCRELDNYFTEKIPIIGWKFGYFFPLLGIIFLYRGWNRIKKSLFYFFTAPAFYMMCLVIILLVMAQILGHRPMLEDVLGNRIDSRAVRRIFEEGIEFMTYFLLLLSAVECYFNFFKKK